MIKKKYRIKKIKEFGYIFRKGKRANADVVSLVWVKSYLPFSKIGISIGTKCGNAVQRNKTKRRLRAIYADLCKREIVEKKKNYILVCKNGIADSDYKKLYAICEKLFLKVKNECSSHSNKTA